MRKGVSPVVAIVLLIAIAVIAAVAVWYWVSPMTSKPATADTTQKTVSIEACYATPNSITIRNAGGYTLSSQTFDLYSGTTGDLITASILNANVSLSPGNSSTYGLGYDLTPGTQYYLRATGFPDAFFVC
jgi:flagellin-like protein